MVNYTNTIQLIPASSTWRLWAPNVYGISDAEFVYQTHFAKSSSMSFNIYQDEMTSLNSKSGRLIMDMTEHKGNLKIILNGNQIFSGTVSGYQTFYFAESGLRQGSNTIEFLTDENGEFMGTATMLIYYDTPVDNEVVQDFVINQSRYDRLDSSRGLIKFNVTRIVKPGGYMLSIEDENRNSRTLAYDIVMNRSVSYYFNTSYCSVGRNTVTLRSVDGSVFYINDFSVFI